MPLRGVCYPPDSANVGSMKSISDRVLRPALDRDLPALQQIEREAAALFPATVLPPHLATPLPREVLQACLAASELWVADEDAFGPIGFIAARTYGPSLHVVEMDVLPGRSRQGTGSRLLQHLCDVARQRGHLHLTLTTFADIPWNAPFYARHGFAEITGFGAFPHLAAALQSERKQGLEGRIAMARDVA
jgi:GNAT superfamily N-acetyltransferase